MLHYFPFGKICLINDRERWYMPKKIGAEGWRINIRYYFRSKVYGCALRRLILVFFDTHSPSLRAESGFGSIGVVSSVDTESKPNTEFVFMACNDVDGVYCNSFVFGWAKACCPP